MKKICYLCYNNQRMQEVLSVLNLHTCQSLLRREVKLIGRQARIWFPGAIYHIMVRGNNKQKIFLDKIDFAVFKGLLGRTKEKYHYKLHAFCLMTNHIHLLLETEDVSPGLIMQSLLSQYALYFNKKYQRVGHLFQDRYMAVLVKSDRYFLATNRYIHLNPVKAFLAEGPADYEHSSYRVYLSGKENSLVTKEKTLEYFQDSSVSQFREFVEQLTPDEELEDQIISDIKEELTEKIEDVS